MKHTSTLCSSVVLALCLGHGGTLLEAQEGEYGTESHHRNHLAVFLGAATETKRDLSHDLDFAIGIEYERRFTPKWGAGVLAEHTGGRTERNWIVLALVSLRPWSHLQLVAGPGVEFPEVNEEEFAFRIGAGWSIPLGGSLSLVPEVNTDFIEGGKATYVYGFALGYGF